MKLTEDQVLHIARLAKLELNHSSLPKLTQDLSDILSMAQTLQKVNCDDIEPLAHPLENITTLCRDDLVSESNCRDALQKGAPATSSGLYLVPQVVD